MANQGTRIGFFLSSEEFTPTELLAQARAAEQAGFHGLWISDHYHPWIDAQGQSSFVWTMLGALSEATSRVPVTTAVTCPTMRIHPAVIAQAAATAAVIYTRPDEPPPILVSGFGARSVDLAARIGDGYCITMPDAALIERFRSSGGGDKPVQAGLKVCFGPDEAEERRTVHRLRPNEAMPGELAQVLPTPQHCEQATELVTEDLLGEAVPCGPDMERHLAAMQEFADAGVDELYIQQIGGPGDEFFSTYAREVLERFPAAEHAS